MAIETALADGNLGTVLDTYGGKSLKRILAVGAAIFGCGLTAAILIRVFRPDYVGPTLVVIMLALGFALGYVRTNWEAALAKVEVCTGGVRLLYRDGATELPWDRIRKVKVGHFRNVRGRPQHVVIRTTDGKNIELLYGFWAAVGTARFARTIPKFVDDVAEDVEFVLPGGPGIRPNETIQGLWFGIVFLPIYGGIFVAVTFAGQSDDPAWVLWALRAYIALFFCSCGSVSAVMSFRELRRRGQWVSPGVTRHPWLAPAGYVAGLLLIASAVIAGFAACMERVFR